MDPDHSIFIIDLQMPTKNYFLKKVFLHRYLLKVILHYLHMIKSQKEETKQ
jgi:hypothetical protein